METEKLGISWVILINARLRNFTGVPDHRFAGLMGLEACDAFVQVLAEISGNDVPLAIERQRLQLLDAMVDTHFVVGSGRVAVAGDPDQLGMLVGFLRSVGSAVVAAVASARADSLAELPVAQVIVGDLEDLEDAAKAGDAQLLVGNSHCEQSASRLGMALLRTGFPQYDWYGGYARQWVGYKGSRQTLFDLANLYASQRREVAPHRSLYWAGTSRQQEVCGPDGIH